MKLGASQGIVQSDTTVFLTSVWGGAQESQSGFLDGVGGRRRLWLAFFKEVPLGGAAVTVLRQGGRGAEADLHGLVLKTMEILQLQFFDEVVPSCPTALRGLVQFLDKIVDVPVAVYVGRASVTCFLLVGAGCCGALRWSQGR